MVMVSVQLMVFSCPKWTNDLLKRYLLSPRSQRDEVLLAAASMEQQSRPEVRNAGAGGVADAGIDNPVLSCVQKRVS
jgi:hypothetical protein